MPDRERIERLASLLMERGGMDAVREFRCGGRKYPDGGKFFRTDLGQVSPMMYEPMMPVYPDVSVPERYYPQPNLGDYEYPASTGVVRGMPIGTGYVTQIPQTGVLQEEALVPVEVSALDARKDAARRIMAVENSKANKEGGWDAETGRWYPHRSHEGGADTIAYGIKLSNGTPEAALALKQGYLTDQQAEHFVDTLVNRYYDAAKKVYDKKYGEGEWDKLSDKSQSILVDYSYNPGLAKFPKLMEGFHSGNMDLIRQNYKRYVNGKELGRNKTLLEEIETLGTEHPIFRAGGGRLFRGGGPKKWIKDAIIGKAAKKVSEFSNGFLSADEVKTILEHPNDYASYLGWDAGKVDELKKNFYDNFSPWGYDLLAGLDALNGGNGQEYPIGTSLSEKMARDYLLASYLGIPKDARKEPLASKMFESSPYKPTIGSGEDDDFVRYSTDYNRNKIVDIYNGLMSNMRGVPGWKSELKPGREYWTSYLESPYRVKIGNSGKNLGVSRGGSYDFKSDPYSAALGQYTLGYGTDSRRGDYISVYDKWDLNPFYMGSEYPLPRKLINTFASLGDASGGFGNPVNFYDRIYLDDYYGVDSRPQNPDEYYGGYILPSVVSSEKASGGKIHIKPSRRGTFTAAAKKHGKSVQAFASQVLANKNRYSSAMVKKANFARNAARWHAEGGILERYDADSIRQAIQNARARQKK